MSVLADVVAAAPSSLAAHAVPDPGPARFDGARAFVLEAVYEGYLMHYREPRAFTGMDGDMRLLAGDALYALGLARLADAGDTQAVAVLADLIAACARAHADGRPEDAERAWEESAAKLA